MKVAKSVQPVKSSSTQRARQELQATRQRDGLGGEYRFQTVEQLRLADCYAEVQKVAMLGEPHIRLLEIIRLSIYYRMVFVPRPTLIADSRDKIAQISSSISTQGQGCVTTKSTTSMEPLGSEPVQKQPQPPKSKASDLFPAILASDVKGVREFIEGWDGEVAYVEGTINVYFDASTNVDTDSSLVAETVWASQAACIYYWLRMLGKFHGLKSVGKSNLGTDAAEIIGLITNADVTTPLPQQPLGKDCQLKFPLTALGAISSTEIGQYETAKQRAALRLAALAGLCMEFNLTLECGNTGAKELYDRMSLIGKQADTIMGKIIADALDGFVGLFDDPFYAALVQLKEQLTINRGRLNQMLRQPFCLNAPVVPGFRKDWFEENRLFYELNRLAPTNHKVQACILYTLLAADNSECKYPVKQLAALLKKISKADEINSADKTLQEAFTAIQASIDFPEIFEPTTLVSGTWVKNVLKGEDYEYYDADGLPWDQKALVADGENEGGRYGKTQTKGGQILKGGRLGPIVVAGLLFDATYCSQDEYERLWKRIFEDIARGSVFARRKIGSEMRPAILEVRVECIANATPARRLTPDKIQLSSQHVFPSLPSPAVSLIYGRYGNPSDPQPIPWEKVDVALQARILAILNEPHTARSEHADHARQLPWREKTYCPHVCFEYDAKWEGIASKNELLSKEIVDLGRIVWACNAGRIFLTVTHYEPWMLVDNTGEFSMPAFFEIVGVTGLEPKVLTIDKRFTGGMASTVALAFSKTGKDALGKLFLGGIELPSVPVLRPVQPQPQPRPAIWAIQFMPANHDCFFHSVAFFVKGDPSQAALVRLELTQYLITQVMKADYQNLEVLTQLFLKSPEAVNDELLDGNKMGDWLDRWKQIAEHGQNCGFNLAEHIVRMQFTHERQKKIDGEAYRTENDVQTIWGDTVFMLSAVAKLYQRPIIVFQKKEDAKADFTVSSMLSLEVIACNGSTYLPDGLHPHLSQGAPILLVFTPGHFDVCTGTVTLPKYEEVIKIDV